MHHAYVLVFLSDRLNESAAIVVGEATTKLTNLIAQLDDCTKRLSC